MEVPLGGKDGGSILVAVFAGTLSSNPTVSCEAPTTWLWLPLLLLKAEGENEKKSPVFDITQLLTHMCYGQTEREITLQTKPIRMII